MRRRRVLLLPALAAASAVLAPAAFSQVDGGPRIELPILIRGAMPQQPTAQPHPSATSPHHPTSTPLHPETPVPHTPVPTPETYLPHQPPASYALDALTISLERTACFGTCPEYTVTIHGDGRVVYEGRRFVRVVGREEDQIERDAVMALLQDFYDAWFFDLRPDYRYARMLELAPDGRVGLREGQVTDLPSQIVTFRVGDYEKRVVDYYGPPPGLRELEEAIDATAGTDRWVKQTP